MRCLRQGIKLCIPLLLFLFVVCSIANLSASMPKIKNYKTVDDFNKGEIKNVAIVNPGYLTLSKRVEQFFSTEEPFVWGWAQDSQGNIYIGTGNDGKVFKINRKNQGTVFFDAEELEIYALAIDKKDNLYVASSPDGKIYQITPQGKVSIYFNPPDKYIWDLEFDSKGNLFAATGDSCRIYQITGVNKGTLFFKSTESHIEEICFHPNGSLLAGSVDHGYIYSIASNGKASILFDSGYREIHSIAVTPDGNIYAGAYGQKRIPRPDVTKTVPQQETKKKDETGQNSETQLDEIKIVVEPEGLPQPMGRERSGLFKITPDGLPKNIWRLGEIVYAVEASQNGTIFAGTGGDNAKLYRLDENEQETLLKDIDDAQITALYRSPDNYIFICTSNMGKLFEMQPAYETEGTYDAPVLDADIVADWGVIRWDGKFPAGTQVKFFTRTGNTEDVNDTWSPWSPALTQASGEKIVSPSSRYLRWKAVFTTTQTEYTPEIQKVAITYLQKNVAPQIRKITVNNPENWLDRETAGDEEYVQDSMESTSDLTYSGASIEDWRKRDLSTRQVRWSCFDENRDDMKYTLSYRGEKETHWRELEKNLTKTSYRWDSEKWPDGTYQIRLVASDSPSNPPSLVKEAEKITDVFLVDNTGPQVQNFALIADKPQEKSVRFTVQDHLSSIHYAEFALDTGDWQVLFPIDGICDSKSEQFQLNLPNLAKGIHTLVIRTYDRFLNVGFGKFQVNIE
ncbi:hypothetical protein JW964_23785 [candidate division KSB1 bacterium]|nr:hypothetical protein [candidate division KSB1 bacterium]